VTGGSVGVGTVGATVGAGVAGGAVEVTPLVVGGRVAPGVVVERPTDDVGVSTGGWVGGAVVATSGSSWSRTCFDFSDSEYRLTPLRIQVGSTGMGTTDVVVDCA